MVVNEPWQAEQTSPLNESDAFDIASGYFFSFKGKATAVFKWVPDGQPTPQKLSIFVESRAASSAGRGAPHTLDNGMQRGSGDTWTDNMHQSKRLKTYSVPASGIVEVGPFSLDASGGFEDMTDDTWDDTYDGQIVDIQLGFSAKEDPRTVKLTRNSKDRFELEGGNWVTYGHTTYSHQQTNPPHQLVGEPTSLCENRQTIGTSFSEGWTSHRFADPRGDYIYYGVSNSWAPAGVESNDISSTYIMPTGKLTLGADGNWRGSSGLNSGTEKHINYYVKDGDGASAQATYVLGIHEPIELISSERSLISYITDYFNPDGTTVKVHYPDVPGGTFEATTSTSSGWSVTGTIGSELQKFKIPIGIEVGYQWTHEEGFTRVAPTPKDAQGNEIRPGEREFMYLRVRHSYNRNHTFFYKYNEEGKERRYNQGLPGETIEVPHEAIWDVFSGDSWTWSEPRSELSGAPQPGDPQDKLPTPSFRYSKKEGNKRAKSAG